MLVFHPLSAYSAPSARLSRGKALRRRLGGAFVHLGVEMALIRGDFGGAWAVLWGRFFRPSDPPLLSNFRHHLNFRAQTPQTKLFFRPPFTTPRNPRNTSHPPLPMTNDKEQMTSHKTKPPMRAQIARGSSQTPLSPSAAHSFLTKRTHRLLAHSPLHPFASSRIRSIRATPPFVIRASSLIRISDFGFRHSARHSAARATLVGANSVSRARNLPQTATSTLPTTINTAVNSNPTLIPCAGSGRPLNLIRDRPNQRRRNRVAQRVNDQNVQRERRGPHRGMRDVGQNRVGRPGVEEQKEHRQKQKHPRGGERQPQHQPENTARPAAWPRRLPENTSRKISCAAHRRRIRRRWWPANRPARSSSKKSPRLDSKRGRHAPRVSR
jgi:hypothetical protein